MAKYTYHPVPVSNLSASLEKEKAEIESNRRSRLLIKAYCMGVPGNLTLAEYITHLEETIAELARTVEVLKSNSHSQHATKA